MASPHASRADHRFGGPEVLDVVDLPDPAPGDGQQLYDVSTAGVNYADTHHLMS
jgi:NADPH:quinone reductase-like Zn-dependent oxidoreductase